MGNRRKLRPHELAKRDQLLAEAGARLRRGEIVTWIDHARPGSQCSWCDCPLTPDSPHHRRGYVCPYLCHAEAAYVAGETHGAFEGQVNKGDRDAFVTKIGFA